MPNVRHKSELFESILSTIEAIPEGCVSTYGHIADKSGTGPRQVAQALKSVPTGRSTPWFRVINSAGRVSDHRNQHRQRELLEAEGVFFDEDRIDLSVYGWELREE